MPHADPSRLEKFEHARREPRGAGLDPALGCVGYHAHRRVRQAQGLLQQPADLLLELDKLRHQRRRRRPDDRAGRGDAAGCAQVRGREERVVPVQEEHGLPARRPAPPLVMMTRAALMIMPPLVIWNVHVLLAGLAGRSVEVSRLRLPAAPAVQPHRARRVPSRPPGLRGGRLRGGRLLVRRDVARIVGSRDEAHHA